LLTSKDKTLLFWWDTFLILDFLLDVFDLERKKREKTEVSKGHFEGPCCEKKKKKREN
jgi:hypothetical protein